MCCPDGDVYGTEYEVLDNEAILFSSPYIKSAQVHKTHGSIRYFGITVRYFLDTKKRNTFFRFLFPPDSFKHTYPYTRAGDH